MKTKTITLDHFEYLNNLVKILGFKNLADYDSIFSYKELQLNQINICQNCNTTLDKFKKLFPLDGFDLRKISYNFQNIDQVIGFTRKVFFYLNVPFEYENKHMRLIQQNNLYNQYIKMLNPRDIPENYTNLFSCENNKLNMPSKLFDEYKSYKEILDENTNVINTKETFILFQNTFEFKNSKANYIESIVFDIKFPTDVYTILVYFGNDVIIEQKLDINNFTLNLKLPNLLNTSTKFTIDLNFKTNHFADLTHLKNIKFEVFGNKISHVSEHKYIKFDHDNTYYNEESMYIFESNKNFNYNILKFDFQRSKKHNTNIYFSSILKYLKLPESQSYIINTKFNFSITNFAYIHKIKILKYTSNKNGFQQLEKVDLNTKITLKLGNENILIDKLTFNENMCIIDLNIPTNYFYNYHELELKIDSCEKNNYCLEIIGSNLKKSFPKNMLNYVFVLDHDNNWYNPNKFVYLISNCLIAKNDLQVSNKKVCKDNLIIKNFIEKNKITTNDFYFNDLHFKCSTIHNTEQDNLDVTFGLQFLCNREHFIHNSVSINTYKNLNPVLKEINDNEVKIYYNIEKIADVILELKIFSLNMNYDACISSNEKYYDTEEPVILLGNFSTQLLIITNLENVNEFDDLKVCIKYMFCESIERNKLSTINL